MSQFAPTVEFITAGRVRRRSPRAAERGSIGDGRRPEVQPMVARLVRRGASQAAQRRYDADSPAHARVPLLEPWTNAEVGEAIEAVSCMAHAIGDFSASHFIERVALTVAMEAGRRLRFVDDCKCTPKPEAPTDAS